MLRLRVGQGIVVLAVVLLLVLVVTACGMQPEEVERTTRVETQSDTDIAELSFEIVWGDMTAEDRELVCDMFRVDPRFTIEAMELDDPALEDAVRRGLRREC